MYSGIDIGGTNIKCVITDKNGKVLSSGDTPTPSTARDINSAISSLIISLSSRADIDIKSIDAIGIGAAGSIDRRRGVVISSPNILSWENHPLAADVEKITGIRTFLENDATVACAGFWWSGGEKFRNFVVITLGTGIGGGAVIDGRLFTGQNGSSLEIGHMTIESEGVACPCGNRGCLERYASATALVEYTERSLKKFKSSSLHQRIKRERLTAKIICEEAVKNDQLAVKAVETLSYYLGIGVANIINILNPEAVVLAGGLSKSHKLIIPVIRRIVNERGMKGMKEGVKIIAIRNQGIIPALGAAKIAMERSKHIM